MSQGCWHWGAQFTAFRLLADPGTYPPDEPYASDGGRFCSSQIPTLYVAERPETAVAEYLRWNPEFLDLQDVLKVRVFRFGVRIPGDEFDLTTIGCGAPFGVPDNWPAHEDPDPALRYRETRQLTRWVFEENGGGIRYRSAATEETGVRNHVLLSDRWERTSPIEEVERPFVERSTIRVTW